MISLLLHKSFALRVVKKNFIELFALSSLLGLHFIFFVFAVKDTTILNATVLVNTTPIFSVFISYFLFKLGASRGAVAGLAISFIGVSIIALAETSFRNVESVGVSSSLKGDFEAVMTALVEAFYLNYGRRIRRQMNILSIMMPIYALTAIIVGASSLTTGSIALAFPTEIGLLLPLLGLGLIPTAIAHTLYFSSLSNLKSFETATMALLEPIGATILGIAIFNEVPVPIFASGAAMILIGIVFIGKSKS